MKGIWEDYEMFEVRLDGVGTLFHHRSTQNANFDLFYPSTFDKKSEI
jgi:hypothetical protein